MEGYPKIYHHGAVRGVTGSCHEFRINPNYGVLIDCGLFQGAETSQGGAGFNKLQIDFAINHLKALIVTHVHIDHVGRIPYLLAAGYKGPIYCSEPSAHLLPLVLEDAVNIGFANGKNFAKSVVRKLKHLIKPVPYQQWHPLPSQGNDTISFRLQRAGHILGSAYVELQVKNSEGSGITVFSGDLGAPHTPLLPAPKPPVRADVLVIESTYGDRVHDGRKERKAQLKKVISNALENRGAILIPAFSIGRTQELLYELEDIIYQGRSDRLTADLKWNDLQIIVDSPLASRFTEVYRKLKPFWDREAKQKIRKARHPLSFEQLTTIDSHRQHMKIVGYLGKNPQPCVIIAASGMCTGGRVVNYLKALIEDARNDILFVGYQAQGTPGRVIQTYGPTHGYVELQGQRYNINAAVQTLSGYSAHADQQNLIRFVRGIRKLPRQVRIVHGDDDAKACLKRELLKIADQQQNPMEVLIP